MRLRRARPRILLERRSRSWSPAVIANLRLLALLLGLLLFAYAPLSWGKV